MSAAFSFLYSFACPLVLGLAMAKVPASGLRPWTGEFFLLWAAAALVGVTLADLDSGFSLPGTAGGAASALLALLLWWWRKRKNRIRALRELGAKSRARLESLVRNMPRPSPRLVPQGVPA